VFRDQGCRGVRNLPIVVALPLNVLLLVLFVRANLMLDIEVQQRRVRWDRLRFNRPRGTPTQWLLATVAFVVGTTATGFATICVAGLANIKSTLRDELFATREGTLLLVVNAGLLLPFFEELLFRGWAYRVFSRWGGPALGFVLSATFWVLGHGDLARIPDLLLSAAVFHLALAATGSLWSCVALHAAFNTSVVVMGFALSDSTSELPSSLVALSGFLAIGTVSVIVFVWQMRRIAKTKTADNPPRGLPTVPDAPLSI